MNDTLEVIKNVVRDPVPAVNAVVIFGLTEMEWELFFTVAVGFASLIWTAIRIANEVYKIKNNRETKSLPDDK